MPEFAPGESKTAIAPIIVKPSGLSCEAEIFLGPDELTKVATSGRIPFSSTGASQNVRLPIAMPSEGTYHVYIDVYAGGILIAAYRAIEDVVILPAVANFVYVSAIRAYIQRVEIEPPWGGTTEYVVFEVDVKNQGGIAALCSAIASCRYLIDEWSDWEPFRYEQYARNNALALKVDSAYINPGETVTFREALWRFAYEAASRIQVGFLGDAGEILSDIIRIYMDQVWV